MNTGVAWRRPVVLDEAESMRARRALAIAIATPVLLATMGMIGTSAAPPKESSIEGSIAQSKPKPTADRVDGDGKQPTDDEQDEGLLSDFTRQLL